MHFSLDWVQCWQALFLFFGRCTIAVDASSAAVGDSSTLKSDIFALELCLDAEKYGFESKLLSDRQGSALLKSALSQRPKFRRSAAAVNIVSDWSISSDGLKALDYQLPILIRIMIISCFYFTFFFLFYFFFQSFIYLNCKSTYSSLPSATVLVKRLSTIQPRCLHQKIATRSRRTGAQCPLTNTHRATRHYWVKANILLASSCLLLALA